MSNYLVICAAPDKTAPIEHWFEAKESVSEDLVKIEFDNAGACYY